MVCYAVFWIFSPRSVFSVKLLHHIKQFTCTPCLLLHLCINISSVLNWSLVYYLPTYSYYHFTRTERVASFSFLLSPPHELFFAQERFLRCQWPAEELFHTAILLVGRVSGWVTNCVFEHLRTSWYFVSVQERSPYILIINIYVAFLFLNFSSYDRWKRLSESYIRICFWR